MLELLHAEVAGVLVVPDHQVRCRLIPVGIHPVVRVFTGDRASLTSLPLGRLPLLLLRLLLTVQTVNLSVQCGLVHRCGNVWGIPSADLRLTHTIHVLTTGCRGRVLRQKLLAQLFTGLHRRLRHRGRSRLRLLVQGVRRCRSSVPGISLESQHGHQTVLGRESSANVGLVPSNLLLVHLLLKRQRLVGGFRLNPCRLCRGLRLRVRSTTRTLGTKQSTED